MKAKQATIPGTDDSRVLDTANRERLFSLFQRAGRLGSWRIDTDTLRWQPMRRMDPDSLSDSADDGFDFAAMAEVFGPHQATHIREGLERLIATGAPFRCQADVVASDNSTARFEIEAEAERGPDGTVASIFAITRDITDGARVTSQPDEHTRLLEQAQRIGRIGHWWLELPGHTLTWSDVLFDITGVPRGTLEWQKNFLDLIVADQRDKIADVCERAIRNREGFQFQADIERQDRRAMVVQVIARPRFDDHGSLTGYFGTTQDVTRQAFTERERKSSDLRLQAVFDALDKAGVGIGVQHADGRIRSARPALLKIAGLGSEDRVLGKQWSELQGADGTDIRTHFGPVLREIQKGDRESVNFENVRWVRPDGSEAIVLIRLAPLPSGERAMIVLDQTSESRARSEIEAREYRTRAILDAIDSAGIGYCIEDMEGRIYDVSPVLRQMLELTAGEELLSRRLRDLIAMPDHIAQQVDRETRSGAHGREQPLVLPEFSLSLPSGRTLRVHARSTPLPGVGRLILAIDQTDRWQMEQQQIEIDRHLQEVQKMEAIGQLAGGVAHEINNMLHPIRTFARAASTMDDAERRAHYLSRIMDCADKASKIVRETLSFARGDQGGVKVLSLNDLLSGVVSFSRDLQMSGIELEVDLPPGHLRASVNETEFTQVLLNLLHNAADAMAGEGIIRLALASRTVSVQQVVGLPAGTYACISVIDNGPGMPPDIEDRAFEPFFTTKEPGKGTGLGLSVVYGIIKRWGGVIDLHSTPGKGVTAEILLPLA